MFQLPVLLVYLLFLTVQIFYNLDIAQHAGAVQVTANQVASHPGSGRTIVHTPASTQTRVHSKLRLNKRFQPSAMPVVAATVVDLPVTIITQRKTTLPEVFLLSSVYLSVCTLRGPPLV